MLDLITDFVNYYFKENLTEFYDDNSLKSCLVYKFLCYKYNKQILDVDYIIRRLSDYRHSYRSTSPVMSNHLIFSLAFREFWKYYHRGRGSVYTFDSPMPQCETLGFLTGISYWFFHKGVV